MNKVLFLFLWTLMLNAQIEEPVEWKTSIKNIKKDTYALTFKAEIAPKWHLYSQFSDLKIHNASSHA